MEFLRRLLIVFLLLLCAGLIVSMVFYLSSCSDAEDEFVEECLRKQIIIEDNASIEIIDLYHGEKLVIVNTVYDTRLKGIAIYRAIEKTNILNHRLGYYEFELLSDICYIN